MVSVTSSIRAVGGHFAFASCAFTVVTLAVRKNRKNPGRSNRNKNIFVFARCTEPQQRPGAAPALAANSAFNEFLRSIRLLVAAVARLCSFFAVILRSAATKDLSSLVAVLSPQHVHLVCKAKGAVACGDHYVTGVAVFRGGLKNGKSLTVARTL